MKIIKLFSFASILLLLAACGGADVESTNFPAMTKTEGDAPFALTAPTSISPAAFVYTSSDPAVATVSGNTVTVLLAGKTTISASQAPLGSFGASNISALLTVNQIACTAPQVRQNGKCAPPPPVCTAPATLTNNVCVAPASAFGNGSMVTFMNATWTPTTSPATWAVANAFCTTTTINGTPGWRLPTEFELKELYGYRAIEGKNWVLGRAWSLTTTTVPGSVDPRPVAVSLVDGSSTTDTNGQGAYYTCIR